MPLLRQSLGQDSSVAKDTCYGLDGSGMKSQWGLDFLHLSRLPWGPPSFLCNANGVSFPSSTEVKKEYSYTSTTSWAFMACPGVNFTLTLFTRQWKPQGIQRFKKKKTVSHLCWTVLHSSLYLKQCNGLSDYLPLRHTHTHTHSILYFMEMVVYWLQTQRRHVVNDKWWLYHIPNKIAHCPNNTSCHNFAQYCKQSTWFVYFVQISSWGSSNYVNHMLSLSEQLQVSCSDRIVLYKLLHSMFQI